MTRNRCAWTRRRAYLTLPAAALLVAVAAPPAVASYGDGSGGPGALIVSASLARQEQADDRSLASVISRDGRYVVFETRAGNLFADDDPDPVLTGPDGVPIPTDRQGGIFRRDLQTGALQKVADGDLVAESDGRVLVSGARNPSVSGDGRFVAFSTAYSLVTSDSPEPRHRDVYVRDMTVAECRAPAPCATDAYEIVSALDGTSTPFTYAGGATPVPGGQSGTEVWPGTSLSADGRRVVLRTVELASDAPGAPVSTQGQPTTASGQLLVRDLDARTTRLQSRQLSDGSPAGGASGPATISGDGSAVVWASRDAQTQVPFLPGEPTAARANYLFWRAVSPIAATRRVTGFVDPEDPGCLDGTPVVRDSTSMGPCYGPLTDQEEVAGNISATSIGLSDDGQQVAFLTPQSRRGQPTGLPNLDLFITRMDGPRKTTTVELSREAIGDASASRSLDGVAMSGDGRYIAVTSSRVRFALPAFTPSGPAFRAIAASRELYLMDRAAGTIERVVRGLGGLDAAGDVEPGVSISADGGRIAFTSAANNLFFGDANERDDAFVAFRQADAPPEQEPEPPPPLPPDVQVQESAGPEPPTLSVRLLKAAKTGQVRFQVSAPSAGDIRVEGRGRLPARTGKRRPSAPVIALGSAKAKAPSKRAVRVTLTLPRKHAPLLRAVRQIPASARVTFTARGAPTRTRAVRIVFRTVVAKRTTKKAPAKKKSPVRPKNKRGS